jgi:hypothetical protein
MTSVRTRIFAAVLALVPAGGLLVAAPAQAATSITVKSVSVSKSTFVLSRSAGCSTKVTFTAVMSAALPTEGYEFSGVGVDLFAPGNTDDAIDGVAFTQVGTTATYKGSLSLCGKYAPGKFRAEIYGALLPADGEPELTNVITKSIYIKRPSALTLNATPEPVVKGKKVTAKGTLKIDGKLLSGAKVKIYFKAKGAAAYTYKGVATTNSKGAYSKAFTATKAGTWKASYAGSTTRNADADTDFVAVK